MPNIDIYHPDELDRDQWRDLQALQRDAFLSTLDRSQAEIDQLVAWDDPAYYFVSHTNPNAQVGDRFSPSQEYRQPRVAIAKDGKDLLGFAYSANNVSGESEGRRAVKRLSVIKNYVWLREIAVRPQDHKRGLAKGMGKALLAEAVPFQPVTAYIWPDENKLVQYELERLGFDATGMTLEHVFGAENEPTAQVRMEAKTARGVLQRLRTDLPLDQL